ncbi:MarR family winged helix-turn-helix transcriptional regulator [Tengunoibacter tsumagoiensis]|uniref:Transcriptional regulator n=1 Tax=Tengunoibacter tsumagoiensis TaxID=2014871 RepID=A0A401ZUY3_9CHLR|nr:MarR family transcriptional regulator [Tengunoibacter tsumagoiensis]GCE10647.1 transcriptional regulator [Tengunoibacter tsumagoiensis]
MSRSATATWVRLLHVYTKVSHQESDLLRRLGISSAHFDALVQTMEQEGLTQNELSQRLLVTKGNVCYLVDKLEHEHLLERRSDGKNKRLFLTSKGKQLVEEILPQQQAMIADAFAPLSAQEQQELRSLLRKIDRELT